MKYLASATITAALAFALAPAAIAQSKSERTSLAVENGELTWDCAPYGPYIVLNETTGESFRVLEPFCTTAVIRSTDVCMMDTFVPPTSGAYVVRPAVEQGFSNAVRYRGGRRRSRPSTDGARPAGAHPRR